MYIFNKKTLYLKTLCEKSLNRVFLIQGEAGSGKTAIGEAIAECMNLPCRFMQCHQWTNTDDLFFGINVSSAIAGDTENVYVKGILAQVAEISLTQTVVCIIDEFDKANNFVENLFLDFLQNGRVPQPNSTIIEGNLKNMIFFFTSNGERDHGQPFLRRVRRVELKRMDSKLICKIVADQLGTPSHIIKLAWRCLEEISKSKTTLQELKNFVLDLEIIENLEELKESLTQWGCRDSFNFNFKSSKWINPLWAEIKKINKV